MQSDVTLFFVFFGISLLASLFLPDSREKVYTTCGLLFAAFCTLGYISIAHIASGDILTLSFFGLPLFRVGLIEDYFLALLSILTIGVSIYSVYYFEEYRHHAKNLRFYISLFLIFLFSLVGVIASGEATTFLVFWEIMSFSSYLLVVGDYKAENALKSGAYYLIITHLGMFCIFLSFLPLINASGSTVFSDWNGIGTKLPVLTQNLVFFAALLGFGSKAGLVPMHVWLPRAHTIAPSNVSALMSGFMIKLPILFLFKIVFVFFGTNIPLSWGVTVLVIALASSFFGIFYALIQSNFKKLLAYSSIENIGIVFIGFGTAMIGYSLHDTLLVNLGFFACVYHIINHACFKTLLFLSAGSLIERTKTGSFDVLGGLAKKLPFLAKILLIGSISIAALPPLNGFISEFIMYIGLIIGSHRPEDNISFLFFAGVIILSITSVFAFIAFTNFYSITFLGEPREHREIDTKSNIFESLALGYFTVAIVFLALVPGYILTLVNRLLAESAILTTPSIHPVSLFTFSVDQVLAYNNIVVFILLIATSAAVYIISRVYFRKVRVVESWNCGYQKFLPTAQYTSFSMIQPIRRIFSYLYLESKVQKRREKSELYAKHGTDFEYQVKDHFIIERAIYDPVIRFFSGLNIHVKRVQNGDLQVYLLYMFVAIIGLLSFYLFF